MPKIFDHLAHDTNAPDRLDRWLSGHFPDLSRSRIKQAIQDGHATLNGAVIRNASTSVKPGDRVGFVPPDDQETILQPQAIPLHILYEDDDLLVVDKPAGLVVHPAPGNPDGTLVNALLHHSGTHLSTLCDPDRPGIVHRIDKDTSGLLVVAKSDRAYEGLTGQFATHTVERRYIAFVRGHPQPASGNIIGAIGRHPVNRKKMAVLKEGGKRAVTHYETLATYWTPAGAPLAARIACRLETGRTHQVRVHMAHLGTALIGDPLYARSMRVSAKVPQAVARAITGLKRQALHAQTLGFFHPATGEFLKFSSPLPYELQQLEGMLGASTRT